jgi:hypothetical protein
MLLCKLQSYLFELLLLSYLKIKWLGNIWYVNTYISLSSSRGCNKGGNGGLVGILNEEKEILQAAVRRNRSIGVARNRNKAANLA